MNRSKKQSDTSNFNPCIGFNDRDRNAEPGLVSFDLYKVRQARRRRSASRGPDSSTDFIHGLSCNQYRELFPDLAP